MSVKVHKYGIYLITFEVQKRIFRQLTNSITTMFNAFKLGFLLFLSLPFANLFAQKLSIEKTYEITGKANRGFLGDIHIDESAGVVELTYCTKSNDRVAKFETYVFDTEFNFKEMRTEELEFEKARTKFKWFRYKGDKYVVEAISVESNLVGTLVLKKKLITYDWNWFWGGYDKNVKLLEKVKPKNDEGNKYYLHKKAENDQTGEVLVIVGEKQQGKGANPFAYATNFSALVINKDLDIVQTKEFKFDCPQTIVRAVLVNKTDADADEDSDDISESDLALVFAPMGGAGTKKIADPNPGNYTYIKVQNDAEILQRTSINSPNAAWAISSIAVVNGQTFIYGPAKEEDAYANQTLIGDLDAMKWKAFQIAKLNSSTVDWVSAPLIDEFEDKTKGGPNQKRIPAYKGKKFRPAGIVVGTDDIFILGQNFKVDDSGVRAYTDPIMFHFNGTGSLKAQYGLRREENNAAAKFSPCMQEIILSNDGKSVYWMIGEIKGLREDRELGNSKYKVLLYPNVAKVELGSATIGDFQFFGQEKYFLNNSVPFLPIDEARSVVFFGESKNGRTLWFGKMPTD